ncbi:MAG: sulfatase, partial [Acidobacteriota bacterium]
MTLRRTWMSSLDRTRARRLLSPLLAILFLVSGDWLSRQPADRFAAARTVTLDTSKAFLDSGLAYWVSLRWIALGQVSDQGGISRVMLFEDGTALTGRAKHAEIRQRGGGLYSHWGDAILFSSRDGSDPRANGRRYEVRLPPTIPIWLRVAQVGLPAAALLILSYWLYGVAGKSLAKTILWAVVGSAAFLVLALGSTLLGAPARELGTIRAAISEASPRASQGGDPAAERPRTRHLLRDPDLVSFTSTASPPGLRKPQLIALQPSAGAESEGAHTVLGDGTQLASTEPLALAASDLELLTLELEVARGGSLSLVLASLENLGGVEPRAVLSFQVVPSAEPQIFRFRRPAQGAMDRVRHVSIRKRPGTEDTPVVRVTSLSYSSRLDAFGERSFGSDPVELGGSLRPASWQSVAGRFAVPLDGRDGDRLKLALGALADSPSTALEYSVSMIGHDGQRVALQRGSVTPREGWRELVLDLPGQGGKELVLEGERLAARSALLWSGARLIDRRQPPRHGVLIVADALRADALGCYGHAGDPTPTLDTLARQGALFTRAFSQGYWTRPSLASLMTGRYVAATGVQALDQRLPETYETLAERFAEGGLTTVGIVTNPNAGPPAGLGQGFDEVRSSTYEQTAQLIAEVVLPTLDRLADDDVFLYLHLIETHGPYGPPEPPAGLELPPTGMAVPWERVFDRPWNPHPTSAQRQALYQYDVRSMDRALGDLLADLDRRWQSPAGAPPIVAFVSDHGEHLGERDQWGHRWADLYPENVQVPLIIRAPEHIAPHTEFAAPVEVRHLAGTLLDLVHRSSADGAAAGSWPSLLPLLESVSPSQPLFALSAAEERG